MPYDDPDRSDPNALVGVEVPGDADSSREMAWAFAEEFASLGYGEEQLWRLFANPHYGGAHRALVELGEAEVRRIVRESLDAFGRVRFVVRDAPIAASKE